MHNRYTLKSSDYSMVRTAALRLNTLNGFIESDSAAFTKCTTILKVEKEIDLHKDYIKKNLQGLRYSKVISRKISAGNIVDEKYLDDNNLFIIKSIREYNNLLKLTSKELDSLEYLVKERRLSNHKLLDLTSFKEIMNGIEKSSNSLYKQILRVKEKLKINDQYLAKRNFYLSLLKYLARSIYKTTPYSSFCTQGIALTNMPKRKNSYDKVSIERTKLSNCREFEMEKIYKLNPNIWIDNYTIILLKPNSNRLSHSFNNIEKLMKIKYNKELHRFLDKFDGCKYTFEQWENTYKNKFDKNITNSKELITNLIKAGFLVESYLSNVNKTPQYFDYMIYKDILAIEKEKLTSYRDSLTPLTNMISKLDPTIKLRGYFLDFIKRNKDVLKKTIPEILYKFHVYLADSNEFDHNFVDAPLKGEILEYIKSNLDKDKIDLNKISCIHTKTNNNSLPASYSFIFQPTKDNKIILNDLYSGFGRSFNKVIAHYDSIDPYQLSEQIFELYGIYGFDGNNIPPQIDNVIDLEGVLAKRNATLPEVKLNVNSDVSDYWFTINNKRIFPVYLGQLATKNLPITARYLHFLNHFDGLNLDFTEQIIDSFIDSADPIVEFPEVMFKNITLSRKKWLLNIVSLKRIKSTHLQYKECISLFKKNSLPLAFFVKPIKVQHLDNSNQKYDIYKPQFINLESIHFFYLFSKLFRYTDTLLITDVNPKFENLDETLEEEKQFEIGIELSRY